MTFEDALAALDGRGWCEGVAYATERLAIMLPDGDVGAVDDPTFVDWLLAHGEPAPFGHGGETKLDPAVRHATRLVARGEARVTGFDPASIVSEVAAELSPQHALVAKLTDVLVYPQGGHFDRHKDTPVSPALVGTLIVGLPITHGGGGFRIESLAGPEVIDWSGPAGGDRARLPWVALFSDLDHAVLPVTSGARVTLVYELSRGEPVRADPAHARRIATLRASIAQLELPDHGPLMIACAHHVIGLDDAQPLPLDALRGTDRVIADVLAEAGFHVGVRTCLVARDNERDDVAGDRFRVDGDIYFARLARPFLAEDIAAILECVVFEQPWGDGGGYFEDEATDLRPWIVDEVPAWNWRFRRSAAVTFLRATEFADAGFVGNGAIGAHLYKLAALEVTR